MDESDSPNVSITSPQGDLISENEETLLHEVIAGFATWQMPQA